VDGKGYSLLETNQGELIWYQDKLIFNVQEHINEWKSTKSVNYNTVFQEFARVETQLTSCMSQYEERLKRVNDYMEQSNGSYLRI
jgi:alpha-acetolactate decarboxylase